MVATFTNFQQSLQNSNHLDESVPKLSPNYIQTKRNKKNSILSLCEDWQGFAQGVSKQRNLLNLEYLKDDALVKLIVLLVCYSLFSIQFYQVQF